MKLAIITLITVLGSSPIVYANWQGWSVWKTSQAAENAIYGKVKTIAIDDESDQLIVKIRKADGSIEVAKVCHEGVQSSKNQVHGSPKLEVLKTAMATGDLVSLSFASNYDRCIHNVQIGKGVKKADANGNGFNEI